MVNTQVDANRSEHPQYELRSHGQEIYLATVRYMCLCVLVLVFLCVNCVVFEACKHYFCLALLVHRTLLGYDAAPAVLVFSL